VGASVDFVLVMPTYEYRCRSCGHTFEVVQKMTDEALRVCPDCGGELRKVFAVPAIAFKGSGFYATDHGKKAKRPSETSDKGDTKDTKKESGSGDAKAGGGATKKDATGSGSKKEASGS
jgi:putative FmdB family regulatory protein